MARFCEDGNENSGVIKKIEGGKILPERLSAYHAVIVVTFFRSKLFFLQLIYCSQT